MSTNEAATPTGASTSPLSAKLRAVASVVTANVWGVAESILPWYERWRQRQALLSLDDHLLKDIGISRAEAELEADKPFWRE